MVLLRSVIFFPLFCFTFFSYAQIGQLSFRHITRSTGLPVDKVTALAQDSSGFIWIGSEEGMFRYDGFTFKAFYAEPGNANTLSENIITKIFVSSKGLIWIGTVAGGIVCMKNDGQVIKTFNSKTTSSISTLADHVSDIKEDKKGNIWWTSVDGLFKFSPTAKQPECYKTAPFVPRGNLFNCFCFGSDGKLWIAGFLGFRIFDPALKIFSETESLPHIKAKKDVSAISFHQNKLWFSSWLPDLGTYNISEKKFHFLYSGIGTLQPDYEKMCNQFYIDKNENLWIATGKGLFFVKQNEENVSQSFFFEPGNIYSITDNNVTSVLADREGNLWFGTSQGISITQPYQQKVINLSTNNLKEAPYGDKAVNRIIEVDNNTLLIATHHADGIYETDSNFRIKNHYTYNDVRYDWIWTYYDDKPRNRLFISTQEGMLIYDKLKHRLTEATEPVFRNRIPISSFEATSDSILWMSRFRDVFIRYNLITGRYTTYSMQQLGEAPQVLYLSKDKQNHIWLIGHGSGLLRFDEKNIKVVERLSVNNHSPSILQPNITAFKDVGNYFIIGYFTKGISLYDKRTHKFQHLSQADGLASNNVKAFFCPDDNRLWIATSNGISLLNLRDKTFKNYDYASGILNNDFLSITQLHSGSIAAGATKGLVVFNPQQVDKTSAMPAPIITEINVYGDKVPIELLREMPVKISYRKNYFSIDYLSLQYNNNSEVEYAYKLEGLDKNWIYAGKRRFASYSNIKGGHYYFKVRARRPGESWIENPVPLSLVVSTAFYKQWWFYALCILASAFIMYVLFRYRVKQVLKLERIRTTISSDLHDEVGASLTSISIFSEMARKSVAPASQEEQYLQRIGERSRDSIEKMSDIIWSINPEHDSLRQMLVRMKNHATEISEASDIAVHWTEGGNLSAFKLSMEQRKNIYLLFKEVMNNVVKHAAAKNVWVHLASTSSNISMKIKDDGKGFDQNNIKYGNGIKSIHRRAHALKGQIFIQSALNKGTAVQLEFRY